jgi:uncharacterized membrane protein
VAADITPLRILVGLFAIGLGLLVTFGLPVSPRRLHQSLAVVLIIVFFIGAAIALFDFPTWLIYGVIACVLAILYRDIARFVKHTYWDVTKYSRRDYWYRRVGEAIIGNRRTSRRR